MRRVTPIPHTPALGAWLNTVDSPPYRCPHCHRREPMHVHLRGVMWHCGHTRGLPPLDGRRGRTPRDDLRADAAAADGAEREEKG